MGRTRLDEPRKSKTRHQKKVLALTAALAAAAITTTTPPSPSPVPMHTSILTGQMWLDELLDGHPIRFYNAFGMKKHIFQRLLVQLQIQNGLVDTKYVKAEEQLAIFIYFARHGSTSRELMERFQRSPDTIRKCV